MPAETALATEIGRTADRYERLFEAQACARRWSQRLEEVEKRLGSYYHEHHRYHKPLSARHGTDGESLERTRERLRRESKREPPDTDPNAYVRIHGLHR